MSNTGHAPVAIRAERLGDYPPIRLVNEAAYGGTEEADRVEALRRDGAVLPDAFMALELAPGALEGARGRVKDPAAFGL